MMKNVWEACTFSDEIVSGHLELHKFAVELHDVLSGNADPVYQDPRKFLDNTYLTSQMQNILSDTLNRLEHSRGMPCIIIDTGFGGGKTHTLMLLYHVLSNPGIGFEYIKKHSLDRTLGLSRISSVRVAAIDCRDVKKNTLWGEIADRLDTYDAVREHDESPRAISNMDAIKGFFDEPTILMIDELPHYLSETLGEKIGDTTKSKLTESFLYKLISAASSSKNSVLVLTLTENQQLYKDTVDGIKSRLSDYTIDEAMGGLKETLSRQTSIRNPVQKEEIYDVLRHRLVKSIDTKALGEIVREYVDYYTQEGLITDSQFHERLMRSYPMHPDFIDTLYERVSTISQFNQTRGTLRFLALVLNDVYAAKKDCTLVGSGDVNLESSEIVNEVTSKIGRNEYRKIIDTDCVGHAQELDRDKPVKVIEPVARTIYLHSLHETPNRKSGITPNQIKLAVGKPGLDTSIIESALHENIKTRFWYVQETNGQFYFVDAVNENAIIAEYAKQIGRPEVDEQIRSALEKLASGTSFRPIVWDADSVSDDTSLKLYVLKYDEPTSKIQTLMFGILGHIHDKPRNHPNTIAFVYADPEMTRDLESAAKELSAIFKAKKDERIKTDKNFLKNMGQKEARARGNLDSMCIKAYCKVGYPNGPEPRLDSISYGDMTGRTIGQIVREFLQRKGKLVTEIGCDAIRVESYKKLEDVYNEFLADKGCKFVEEMKSVQDAARDGVLKGLFGYSDSLDVSKQKHPGVISVPADVRFSGYIIHKDLLEPDSGDAPPRPMPSPSPPTEPRPFEYSVPIHVVSDVIRVLDALVVGEFQNVGKNLCADLEMAGNTRINLTSKLEDITAVKSIVTNLRSYSVGDCAGSLTLHSDSDISDTLREYGMGASEE
ncbi:MAG: DUF499 domain-containing protein [Thaumarchaeota archaeon]|nr:DUF499 domain-containing protein [Nitrososphaerota archaeon]